MDIVFTILSLVGFIALTAGTALFVAAEFSLTALERSTVDEAARGGDRRSRQVQHAHKTLSFQLSGAQLGITITTLITVTWPSRSWHGSSHRSRRPSGSVNPLHRQRL